MAKPRRDLRAGQRPTASSKQPGFLKLRARGNDAVWGRATRNISCRTSQRSGAWLMRDVRMAGIAEWEMRD
jgi:hypothetical protein